MADIAELLSGIKQNIGIVESGNHDASFLKQIEADFLEFLELAKLFLISERDSYYGYFLMNMQLRANFYANSIAGIQLNTFPPVLEANPLLLCKFTLKEILYILCHEIDHVVFNHPAEMVKANPEQDPDIFYRFNLAADAAVNDAIDHEITAESRSFLASPKGLITSRELARMFRLKNVSQMESYAYYFQLISTKSTQSPKGSRKNGQECIFEAYRKTKTDMPQDSGPVASCGTDQLPEKGDSIVTANNCDQIEDHNWNAGTDVEDATAAVQELVNAAVGMMSDKTRGAMPASFLNQVEKLNAPAQLSWQAILKKYVGTLSANKRKTKMRLNRRQPDRFDLSGSVDDKILKIVVAIDTSASVDNHMIAQIFCEIFAILAKRKHEITVIECDSKVQRIYRAKDVSEIKTKVTGRGGTCFSPVIEYVNSDRHYRDALMIYFTDGFGERSIPKPRTYRNIWVVFDDVDHLSLEDPYGVVLRL